ncbi:MAG: hypothetical protein HY791_28785 [Deltaproteobacteria bacterium]|nr:hypothetical protein [Deltaproteobacteria bacterium]
MGQISADAVLRYRDRSWWLGAFGVLEVLLGLFLAALIPLLLLAQAAVDDEARPSGYVLQGVLIYGLLGATFIWLGIGSFRCRRWARSLLLALAWNWLAAGATGLLIGGFLLPKLLESVPEGAKGIVTGVIGIFAAIFLGVPVVLIAFYRSDDVRATCEARDPGPSWVATVPVPVLMGSIWCGVAALGAVSMGFMSNSVLPFFGLLLSGAPGLAANLLLACAWGYSAVGLLRLRPAAWWLATSLLAGMTVSVAVTFSRVDLAEMYGLMGYGEQVIAQTQALGSSVLWWSALALVPVVGYFLWLRRYFVYCGGNRP